MTSDGNSDKNFLNNQTVEKTSIINTYPLSPKKRLEIIADNLQSKNTDITKKRKRVKYISRKR